MAKGRAGRGKGKGEEMSYTGGQDTVADGAWEDGYETGQKKILTHLALLMKLEDWRLDKVIEFAEDELKAQS